MTDNPRVVVVGGGFGGLEVARGLGKAPVRVTVIDRANHHLFQPLLYQVATAGLSPADIAAPIRSILHDHPNTEVMMAEVDGVDLERRCVHAGDDCIPYDYLVLATGSHYNYFGHPEWKRVAPSLKSVEDATTIRRDILLAFEAAEVESDEARRRALLTFVLVGAGPTGVEMAGAIGELAHRALTRDFRRINPRSARILLVEAGPRILSPFPEKLARAAEEELRRMGVEVRANTKVEAVDEHGVQIGSERIGSETVIWTAGVVASPVARWLGVKPEKGGRVRVGPDLAVPGHPEVFVIGDAAFFEQNGEDLPGLAPVAMQQGRYMAALLAAKAGGKKLPGPFHYHDKGILATVGRSFAIISVGKLKLAGFVAWVLWLAIHIWYLIGFRNRLLVMMQWAWAYLAWQRGARLITWVGNPEQEEEQRIQQRPAA